MKIAFIGNLPAASVLPHEVIRPAYRSGNHPAPWMVALLPELARLTGFQMRVFLPQRSVMKRTVVERDGIEYEGLPIHFTERWNPHTFYLGRSLAAHTAIRSYRPDVIHAFGIETGSATVALRTGFPVSCFIQGIVEHYFPYIAHSGKLRRRFQRIIERSAASRIRWFVAETEFARDWALSHNPDAHVALIPHPVRAEFLQQDPTPKSKCVISVGSVDQRKAMDTIVRALALVKDKEARLCVVGGGAGLASLRDLASELGVADRVDLPGALETGGVLHELNRSKVYVIASRMDTSPNVLTEAHAMGLPVIGTRAGGIPEMIDHGRDGFLVNVDDAKTMAERIDELIANPEMAEQMGQAGRKKVSVLNDPRRIAEAHVEFFERIKLDLGR